MLKNTLIDAGPLISLFDRDDLYHAKITRFLKSYRGYLLTTWPVLTEVCHMLDFSVDAQIDFLKWVSRGGVKVFQLSTQMFDRIIELTAKYSDTPMDLADASLIIAAEKEQLGEIITIDSDFYIYRTNQNRMLTNVFAASL